MWLEVPVTVTFESDWIAAREMVQEIIEGHAADPGQVVEVADYERAANEYFSFYRDLALAVYVKAIDLGATVTGRAPARPATHRVQDMAGSALGDQRGAQGGAGLPDHPLLRADLEGSASDGE